MKPLVIYIIGDQRSGSTLLDYLLSFHPDSHSVGELHNLAGFYHRSSMKSFHNWGCSCGHPVADCNFWTSILRELSFKPGFKTKINYHESKLSYLSRPLFKKILNNVLKNEGFQQKGREIAHNCWELYREVGKQTGKSIIIDSSKNAIQAYFLSRYCEGNIRFLLLERDIGAIAYSKLNREKKIKHRPHSSIYTFIMASYKAKWKNRIIADMIGSENTHKSNMVKEIQYLDLASHTDDVISDITSSFEIARFPPPEYTNQKDNDGHTIGGSPSRFEKRKIEPDLRHLLYYDKRPFVRCFKKLFS